MIQNLSAMCLQCSTEASPIYTHLLHAPFLYMTRCMGDYCRLWVFPRVQMRRKILFTDLPHNIFFLSFLFFLPKGVELLVCDLLLTLRTSIWQRGGSSNGEPSPAPGSQLAGFQRDLSALRKVTQCYRQAQHKVHTQM